MTMMTALPRRVAHMRMLAVWFHRAV